MTVFQLAISEQQLLLIKDSLQSYQDNTILGEEDSEETDLLIGMITDVVEEGDTETLHGFCY